jgi:hypothetical protein
MIGPSRSARAQFLAPEWFDLGGRLAGLQEALLEWRQPSRESAPLDWHIVWISIGSRTRYARHSFSQVAGGRDEDRRPQRRNVSMGCADIVPPCAVLV